MRRLVATLPPLLLLLGCVAAGTSEGSRFWALPKPENLGPKVRVFLPVELRTPRVVTFDASGAPVNRDLDRWATPLASALAGLISEELLIGLPVREAVVEFRELRVQAGGDVAIAASYRMTVWSLEGGPDVTLEGRTRGFIYQGNSGGDETETERIVGAYASAARMLAADMRKAFDRQDEDGVAKPEAAVTVPGK